MKKIIYISLLAMISVIFLSCSQQKNISSTKQNKNAANFNQDKKGVNKNKSAAQFTSRQSVKYNPKYIKTQSVAETNNSDRSVINTLTSNSATNIETKKAPEQLLSSRKNSASSVLNLEDNKTSDLQSFEAQRKHAENLNNFRKRFINWTLFYSNKDPDVTSLPEGGQINQTEGFGIISLVLGILGLFVFPYIFGGLAVIFGAIGLGRIQKYPRTKGRGLAIAGIIIGFVAIIGALILTAVAI